MRLGCIVGNRRNPCKTPGRIGCILTLGEEFISLQVDRHSALCSGPCRTNSQHVAAATNTHILSQGHLGWHDEGQLDCVSHGNREIGVEEGSACT